MTNDDRDSTLRKNRYIFASAGAVLGVAAGAGMGSLAAALVGAVLGGVLGYHLLTRIGGGTKSDEFPITHLRLGAPPRQPIFRRNCHNLH